MGRTARVLLLAALSVVMIGCFWFVSGKFFPQAVPDAVVLTAVLTMALIALLVEHYFETPSTVIATAISALLLLAPARDGLSRLGPLYWGIVAWCLSLLVVSTVALLVLPDPAAKGAKAERTRLLSRRLKRIAARYGNARLVFGLMAVITSIVYLSEKPPLVFATVGAVVLMFGLDTRAGTPRQRAAHEPAGAVTSVEPSHVVRVSLREMQGLKAGDSVAYSLQGDPEGTVRSGRVAEVHAALDGPEATVVGGLPQDSKMAVRPGDVVITPDGHSECEIGLVTDGSHISSIKVDTLGLRGISEGSLLAAESTCGDEQESVLYQVFDASCHSDESRGTVLAHAVQLGTWDSDACGFRRHGWVPDVNGAVRCVDGKCRTEPPAGSILLGHLPGTEYPVVLDRDVMRGGHLAVLGVTGCGKSVTSRYLVREIASDSHRVVVIDLTGEYKRMLTDPKPSPVVSDDVRDDMTVAIETLMTELSKFANQRTQATIDKCEQALDTGFRESLNKWLESGTNTYALLELPSFESTATSLEYTRWFLRTLFDIARSEGFGGRGVTVVLEEAHTVVPEWNFAGARGDKVAEGLLNSIAQIALQGRKYGIGFIVIAQRTANVSKTVLTQCSSVIAFRSYDNTSADFLANYLGVELAGALPNLADRHAVVVGSAFRSQVPLICRVLDIQEEVSMAAPETVQATVDEPTESAQPMGSDAVWTTPESD